MSCKNYLCDPGLPVVAAGAASDADGLPAPGDEARFLALAAPDLAAAFGEAVAGLAADEARPRAGEADGESGVPGAAAVVVDTANCEASNSL